MRKRTIFRDCLLSAAVAALPGLCIAGGNDSLRPLTPGTSTLRQVPSLESASAEIQQTGFEAGGTTSSADAIDSELQSLFAADNDLPSVVRLQTAVDDSSSIDLVMYKDDSKEETEGRRPRRGLLRRWYKKLAGTDDAETEEGDAQALNSGQPGVSIPKPPPIDYSIRSGGAAKRSGVPAKPVGFQSGSGSSRNTVVGQERSPDQTSPTPKRAPNDQFINPFEPEYTSSQAQTLIDLDSLINNRTATSQVAEREAMTKTPAVEADLPEQRLPNTDSEIKVLSTRKTTDLPSPGPFSGYQLPSDDQVLGLADAQSEDEENVVEPVVKPEPQVVQENGDSAEGDLLPASPVTVDAIIRVPLLEEPEMALPPVRSTAVVPEFEGTPTAEEAATSLPPIEKVTTDLPSEQTSQQANEHSIQQQESLKVLDSQARREQQRYRIMARTGKVGFKGFCPVALRDARDLLDSRERHAAKFGLQTYYFSSPEAVSAFEANPSRYAPAGGGSDVVLLVNTGEETPGTLDFSLWYRDRLYMFRSRETQAIFSSNPRRFADQY